jgi:hypothetical protein
MLKKQKEKNIQLLYNLHKTRILNENILKKSIYEYRHKQNL